MENDDTSLPYSKLEFSHACIGGNNRPLIVYCIPHFKGCESYFLVPPVEEIMYNQIWRYQSHW